MNTLPTVLLLAGGDSTRLWPISDKHSVTFLGKPLIYHSFSQLARFGFEKIVVITSEKNHDFIKRISEDFTSLHIELVPQTDMRGMAGAVLSTPSTLSGNVLIIGPSDIYEDALLSDFKNELKNDPKVMLTGISKDAYFPGGYLDVKNGKVVSIIEKPAREEVKEGIVRLVFDYFSDFKRFRDEIQNADSKKDDLYEVAISSLINKKIEVSFLSYKGYWGHIKYPWDVLSVCTYFLSRIKGPKIMSKDISPTAKISGDVYIEEGVKVFDNAVILGPTYIGRNTIIGNNTLIRESIIGQGCVIGFSSEIARSVVSDYVYLHNNYVGDSYLGNNVGMGALAVTANFRLDEKTINSEVEKNKVDTEKVKFGAVLGDRVKVGVHTALMPGIKIGHDSFISSGSIVEKDVPDNSFYKSKTSYEIVSNKHKTEFKKSKTK